MKGLRIASNICILIGLIVSIIVAACCFISAIPFIIFGTPACTDIIRQGVEEGIIHTGADLPVEETVAVVQGVFLGIGITEIVAAIFATLNAVFSGIAHKQTSKTNYILNIVFGILSCVVINMIGAVLGLIVLTKKRE